MTHWNRARSPPTATGRWRSASDEPRPVMPRSTLGVAEGDQPGLRQRVDRHDRRAVALGLLEGAEHARVVGSRVLPGDEDQLGGMDVVERDGALADADRLAEGHATRLVAHVRAVREVVRAEGAGEQLVQEGGLVARPPRRVEHGAVRRREGPEVIGDDGDGARPRRSADSAPSPTRPVHRLGEPALLAEPVVGPTGEVGDRVGGEEVGGDAAVGGLLGDRLGAVLAELEPRRVVWLRPRASRTVEPVRLVDPQHRASRLARAHLLVERPHRGEHSGQSPPPIASAHRRSPVVGDVVTRRGLGHQLKLLLRVRADAAGRAGNSGSWPVRLCHHQDAAHRRRQLLGTASGQRGQGVDDVQQAGTHRDRRGGVLFAAATPPLLAGAESPGAGSTTTTRLGRPTTSAGDEFVLPAGFEFLVDDTNRITIAVPTTWTDVSTVPTTVDGALVPSINASTDLDAWEQNLDVSRRAVRRLPVHRRPAGPDRSVGTLRAGATPMHVVPYADGVFTGSWAAVERMRRHRPSARGTSSSPVQPARTFTAAVVIQLAGRRISKPSTWCWRRST